MMRDRLTDYEKETIITFNEEESQAYIFTYSKKWQRHLEQKLGLKARMDNGSGGKDYEIAKKRIPMPRVLPGPLSPEAKTKLRDRLVGAHRNAILAREALILDLDSAKKTSGMGKTSAQQKELLKTP